MNKEALIAECKLRIERCESALRQRTVSPEVVEVSLELMRIALAAMEANPVGTVSIVQDLYGIPRRNIATVNMRPDVVLSEMRDGDNLYTAPPAASVPDGWKLVPNQPTQRMIDAHTEGMANGGATRAYRDMLAAAPAPGGE